MLQFYFLSILLNLISGLVFLYSPKNSDGEASSNSFDDDLFSDSDDENSASSSPEDSKSDESKSKAKSNLFEIPLFQDASFRLVLGILMVLTGLMKLLSPIQYDVPVVGDLIPALAGLFGGFSILLEWYRNKSTLGVNLPEVLDKIFVDGRKYLGIFCIAAAVLHFIFPRVLFL